MTAKPSTVGRDSVEPSLKMMGAKKHFSPRSHPAAGVHIHSGQSTIVFLTVSTLNRQRGIADHKTHQALIEAWQNADAWSVGDYVVMPDHLHVFCAPRNLECEIESWIAYWKWQFRKRQPSAPRFQSRGFHHRLRRSDNYEAKIDYVLNNPVRAGLVAHVDSWPFRGKLNELVWK
jgi:putative transposase